MDRSSQHPLSRRRFLQSASMAGVAATLHPFLHYRPLADARAITARRAMVDRSPLIPGAYSFLPLGSIEPRGWLHSQLRIQAEGLSGHLDETWDDVGPNSGWLGGTGESWERGPYYLDGLVPLAWLLDDAALKAKAQRFIDWTLEHPAANGMIGPSSNNDWWPRMVMWKALTQYQELSGDPRVIPAMDRYLRYQLAELPSRPLRDWGRFRWQDALLSVIWLYNRTGASYLLDLARLLHQQGYDWTGEFACFPYTQQVTRAFLNAHAPGMLNDLPLATHGVNNGQAIKTGPVWSLISGSQADRQAAFTMTDALDRYHGLPNGMFSCDEHLAGLDPSQGSELCTVVEYMFSLEQALAITGDPRFSDRLEKLAFNALPAAFTDDMWAHQYNQEPNQVECSLHHKPWTTDGPESNLYGLEPNFGCCTANFSQGWPKFANSLFLFSSRRGDDSNDGLVAAAYAPCSVGAVIGESTVRINVETEYPFRGQVRLSVHPDRLTQFPLRLRIPGWAEGAEVRVNGRPLPSVEPGAFLRVDRAWQAGDTVELQFPVTPRVVPGARNSISIERGPLVFSYGIEESWVKLRQRGMTADWQVFPAGAWNYGLQVDREHAAEKIEVTESPVGPVPFARSHPPVELHVPACLVDSWRADDGATNPLPANPKTEKEPATRLSLIPYASAKLRITAFPQLV